MTTEGIGMLLFAIFFLALFFFAIKMIYRKVKGAEITCRTTIYFYISFWGAIISIALYELKEGYVSSAYIIDSGLGITSIFLFLKAIYSVIKKRGNAKKLFAMSVASFFVIVPITDIAESLEPEDMRTARLMKKELRKQEKANGMAVLEKEKQAEEKARKEKILEEERQELQKKYDAQKQYEEWIAWQKSEEEKKESEEKERQRLQKMYDDQAKYEEWLAWKKATEKEMEHNQIQQDDNKSTKSNDDGGIIGTLKSYVKDVIEDEVYIYTDRFGYDYYLIPSTKRNSPVGLVFKDEGYKVTLKIKDTEGTSIGKLNVSFWNNDGDWECRTDGPSNSGNQWEPISTWPDMETLFMKSRFLPNRS